MHSLTIFEGGSLAKLTTKTEIKKNVARRGKISTFSTRSRRRIMETINKINKKKTNPNPIFITLTYPSQFPKSHRTCKRHLDIFFKSLERHFPDIYSLWRLEYQVERGTRRGAPHYHLIIFQPLDSPPIINIKSFRSYIAHTWYNTVKSGDPKHLKAGTQADFMKSWRGLTSYCSKYLAKVSQSGVPAIMEDLPGRFWGIYFRKNMSIDESTMPIDADIFYKIRRTFYHLYKTKVGHKYKFRNSKFGLSVYISAEESYRLLHFIAGST